MKKIGFGVSAIIALIILVMGFTYRGLNLMDGYVGGKRPIIMGSDDFEPQIKQNALCIVEKVDETNRNDLQKGDTVLFNMPVGDKKVMACGVIQKAGKNKLTIGAPADKELVNVVKRTQVNGEIVSNLNFTAPILKVFANQIVFIAIMLICFAVDVLWILLFVRRKMGEN